MVLTLLFFQIISVYFLSSLQLYSCDFHKKGETHLLMINFDLQFLIPNSFQVLCVFESPGKWIYFEGAYCFRWFVHRQWMNIWCSTLKLLSSVNPRSSSPIALTIFLMAGSKWSIATNYMANPESSVLCWGASHWVVKVRIVLAGDTQITSPSSISVGLAHLHITPRHLYVTLALGCRADILTRMPFTLRLSDVSFQPWH